MNKLSEASLNKLGKHLISSHQTIAVAESVTAGLFQHILSNIPDASQFFQGGITAYNLAQKFKHLQIEPIHAGAVNCVSEQVAEEMAKGVSSLFNSYWGIGITGYATPVPESDDKLFAFYAIAMNGKIKKAGRLRHSLATPEEVQQHYAQVVLQQLGDCFK